MKLLTSEEFLETKKSNTMVVLGSGYSIKSISESGWNKISQFDSIGFNWFCHHSFGPNYFLVREQASNASRNRGMERMANLYSDLSKSSYINTVVIISDMSRTASAPYSLKRHKKNIKQKGIIKKDLKGRYRRKFIKRSIFEKGIFHGRCTLTNVIHIILSMKYEKIIFAGVDLNNCQYFWLSSNKTRKSFMKLSKKSKHPIARKTLPLIRDLKTNFKIGMISISRKSLLNKVIPYKHIDEI